MCAVTAGEPSCVNISTSKNIEIRCGVTNRNRPGPGFVPIGA
jgi:hypothetical protein